MSDGVGGIAGLVLQLAAIRNFKFTTHRVLADGNLVAIHGTYVGLGPQPVVAFDIYRVDGDRIVEHWDGVAPQTPPNPSGRTQTDGPTEIVDLNLTAKNRALVEGFISDVLTGGQFDRLLHYIDLDHYHQHSSTISDGHGGLSEALTRLARQGILMEYRRVHRVVAEGNFVLTQSEGAFGGEPTAYYDLFRVADGMIVEHWDVMQPIQPASSAKNANGMF